MQKPLPSKLRAAVWASALVFFFLSPRTLGARTLDLSDLRNEVTFFDPAVLPNMSPPVISPDGVWVACIVSQSNYDDDTSVDRIVLIDAASGSAHALLRDFYGVRNLRWSPGGDRLAFLGSVQDGNQPQLFVIDTKTATRRALTASADRVDDFAWSPDGFALAFSAADRAPRLRGPQRFVGAFAVHDNDYLTTAAPLPSHLWSVAATGGAPHQLTRGSWMLPKQLPILPQHFPSDFFSWSPDGKRVVFTKTLDAYPADDDHATIAMLDLRSGRAWKLTKHAGLESGGAFSPNGRYVAYWYPRAGQAIAASDIYVTSPSGGDGVDVTAKLDRSPWFAQWMPNSRALLVGAHDGTHENLWIVALDGSYRKIDVGDLNVSAASVSRSGAIAFVASGPQSPSELFYLSSPTARLRKLTNLNGYFSTIQLGRVESIRWPGPDGFQEDGVLTYPPAFVKGRRYPLVLQLHGWPAYASQTAFDTDYPGLTQYFAAHGYVVFEPNYRGSDNLGNRFQFALFGDTADGPARDIMAGVAAVEKRGFTDPRRLAVSGWSYGGFLTAWLISHSDAWKAAVVGAGPTDLPADYAISDYNVLDRYYYGGSPWSSKQMWQLYQDQSVMPYAWNVHTPTLILSSTGDTTVPVTHGYELYHALHDRGVPVSFIAYDSNEHFPSDPIKSEDIYRRWRDWLDRYLR
ncbi:MAG TPA: S9 family peptidase [Candidatus Eremiobacteraceae bacterium]|nr:S9 family peptidase [Candidatus Eremiobacteraceae bacterium]